jgi:hypothetical protein
LRCRWKECLFFLSIKRIMRTTFMKFCEAIWPGADGLIRIFTFPRLVIIYCKETAQTRKGRAMQSAFTKSQIMTPEPGIEPGSTWWEAGSPPTTPSALAKECLCDFKIQFLVFAFRPTALYCAVTLHVYSQYLTSWAKYFKNWHRRKPYLFWGKNIWVRDPFAGHVPVYEHPCSVRP